MDKIHIRDLSLRCIIGIFDNERLEKQDVIINVTLHCDLSQACNSDDFNDTVDYKTVKKKIMKMVEESNFLLIEALAGAVADICLEFEKVKQVDVTVEKPGALRFVRTVDVEISRSK